MYENKALEVLNKIVGTGLASTSEFLSMSAVDMIYSIPSLEPDELSIAIKLQDGVRDGNLFESLCGKETAYEQEDID